MPADSATGKPLLGEPEVRNVAKLARLELRADEIARMATELSAIVGYVQKLGELDTTDVPPTAHVRLTRVALRDDVPRPCLSHDEALAEAPRVAEDGFAVPAFVDD